MHFLYLWNAYSLKYWPRDVHVSVWVVQILLSTWSMAWVIARCMKPLSIRMILSQCYLIPFNRTLKLLLSSEVNPPHVMRLDYTGQNVQRLYRQVLLKVDACPFLIVRKISALRTVGVMSSATLSGQFIPIIKPNLSSKLPELDSFILRNLYCSWKPTQSLYSTVAMLFSFSIHYHGDGQEASFSSMNLEVLTMSYNHSYRVSCLQCLSEVISAGF